MGTACAMKSGRCDGWRVREGKYLGGSVWKSRMKYTACKTTSSGWDNITKQEMYV
jgi:hypothetical protein